MTVCAGGGQFLEAQVEPVDFLPEQIRTHHGGQRQQEATDSPHLSRGPIASVHVALLLLENGTPPGTDADRSYRGEVGLEAFLHPRYLEADGQRPATRTQRVFAERPRALV